MSAIEISTTSSLQRNDKDSADVNHFMQMVLWRWGTKSEKKSLGNQSKGTRTRCQTTSCQHTEQKSDAHQRKEEEQRYIGDRPTCGMGESWLPCPSTAGHMINFSPSELPFPLQLLTWMAVKRFCSCGKTVWTGQLVARAGPAE